MPFDELLGDTDNVVGAKFMRPVVGCDSAPSMHIGWGGGRNEFGPYNIVGIPERIGRVAYLVQYIAFGRDNAD